MKTACSSCDAEIDAESPRCPVCLSERSRAEIFQALRGQSARSGRWAATLRGLAMMVLGIGGTALGARWTMQRNAAAREAQRQSQERVRKELESKNALEAASRRTLSLLAATASANPSTNAAAKSQAAATLVKKADTHWTFSGEVYDLMSLSPVATARVKFKPEGSSTEFATQTGGDGRFTLRVPKKDAPYAVSILHKGYDGAFVEDGSPPFRQQSKALRRDAAQTLRDSPVLHVPLSPPDEDDAAEVTFVMLPKR